MASVGLIALVLGLLALRQNIVVILLCAAGYAHAVWGRGVLSYLIEDMWIAVDSETLLAIPMFLVAGQIMARGSIAHRLVVVFSALTSGVRGGLAVATILMVWTPHIPRPHSWEKSETKGGNYVRTDNWRRYRETVFPSARD